MRLACKQLGVNKKKKAYAPQLLQLKTGGRHYNDTRQMKRTKNEQGTHGKLRDVPMHNIVLMDMFQHTDQLAGKLATFVFGPCAVLANVREQILFCPLCHQT